MVALPGTVVSEARLVDSDTEIHGALMERIAVGRDKKAFESLFAHFAPKIKALMLKQDSDPELAEDLMQDTMLTVWNKAHQFASWRGSVSAWIFTIARNRRIDRFRRQGTRHYIDIADYEIADETPDSEDCIMAGERDRLVAEATSHLPEEQKQIIAMSFVENLAQTEIADRLGIPLGTVKSRMRLAYKKIKTNLEDVL
ncbi:MAG: sigma-70 family RNA polymerase sigma factor [Rhizobiaceae bacterium]